MDPSPATLRRARSGDLPAVRALLGELGYADLEAAPFGGAYAAVL